MGRRQRSCVRSPGMLPMFNLLRLVPRDRHLAGGSALYTIKLWDVPSGRELRTLAGHSGSVKSLAFSADGKTIASGSSDKTIKFWEVATGRELRTLTGHTGSVASVTFSLDGKTFASGSHDETIKLWQVGHRSRVAHAGWTLFTYRFNCVQCGWKDDSQW